MATLFGASSGTLELTVTAAGTQPYISAKIGSGSNPSNQILSLAFGQPAGTRVIEQDSNNFVMTAPDDALEFVLAGNLVASLDIYARLQILGIVEEVPVSTAITSGEILGQTAVLVYNTTSQNWTFGVTDTGVIKPVVTITAAGDVRLYEGLEDIFPLTAAASPSFGSDYFIDSSDDTHITQDLSRTSAWIEQSTVETKIQGTLYVQEIIEKALTTI